MTLNDDFSVPVVLDTAQMPWVESPSPSVWRKRLDHAGPEEAGRVTSVVRYDPGSRFRPHEHPDGEEILVLEGVFSDERGDFPAGTYMLNPEGFRHGPFSEDGCLLFVKLRQYGGDRETVLVDTTAEPWVETQRPGISCVPLYASQHHEERMHLMRFDPGAQLVLELPGGGEVFVLDGELEDARGRHGARTWLRWPPGHCDTLRSSAGCRFYAKVGLPAQPDG